MTNPIEAAIAPQRDAVVANAEATVRARLLQIAEKLQGTDLRVSAPYPRANISKADYRQQQAYARLARQIVSAEYDGVRYPGHPEPVVGVDLNGIERTVKQAGEAAAASFDAYVAKLTEKVGACDSASVDGSLWAHSILTVTKGSTVERWKTQQILNVSVLGTLFNQWPTRKLK